jgi:hypothetical protein
MKKLVLAVVAAFAAAVLVPAASAGGWATVGLSSLPPNGLEPNQAWPVDITVLQHGQTPLSGVAPVVTVRDDGGSPVGRFTATPTDEAGTYHAVVRFPAEGTYSYDVYDGFEEYGGAQTHTFKSVVIGPAGSSFPYLPVGLGLALVLGLALAATTIGLRRRGPAPKLAEVVDLKKAA